MLVYLIINIMQKQLEEQGFVLLPGLLSEHLVGMLKAEQARFASRDESRLSVQVQLVHQSIIIRDFVCNGPQIPIVVEALGENVCFTHQQYVTKYADEKQRTDVPWHQDNGYGRLVPANDLTVWIALDDCDTNNGCLWVHPGSQKLGDLPHHGEHGLRAADVEGAGIALPMQAGDAVMFGSLLLHRSLANTTSGTRVAMYVRYCTPEVNMVGDTTKPVLEDGFSWMVAGEA